MPLLESADALCGGSRPAIVRWLIGDDLSPGAHYGRATRLDECLRKIVPAPDGPASAVRAAHDGEIVQFADIRDRPEVDLPTEDIAARSRLSKPACRSR